MKIVVLYGGDGSEKEVSLRSGQEVCRGLREAGHIVIPWEVSSFREVLERISSYRAEMFFIALHGDWGEDGRLQAVLSGAGKAFSGSSFSACSISMDKWKSKVLFQASEVPVAPALFLKKGDSIRSVPEWVDADDPRVVVKPNSGGSTIGVSIVDINDQPSLETAIDVAFSHDRYVIVEKYIPGRELTVTVTGNEKNKKVLPVVEIVPVNGFYSYEAKYTSGKSSYNAPADLQPEIHERVREASLRSYDALGCDVYARIDIRLDHKGIPFVLEVNTVPGMTATSLVPKAASAAGIAFSSFLDDIVKKSLCKDQG